MRQINFTLIFSFGLLMVFFTLVNTAPTTVHVFQGWNTPCLWPHFCLSGRCRRHSSLAVRQLEGC